MARCGKLASPGMLLARSYVRGLPGLRPALSGFGGAALEGWAVKSSLISTPSAWASLSTSSTDALKSTRSIPLILVRSTPASTAKFS